MKKTFIYCNIILLFFSIPLTAVGTELVGVLPFANQRSNQQNDWLGFYIQARIEANLRNNSDWQFHGSNVLRLWKYRSDTSRPISSQNTVRIDGSFQQVLHLGYLALRVRKTRNSVTDEKIFELAFTEKTLDRKLDAISLDVGRWIKPEFAIRKPVSFPSLHLPDIKDVFRYRRIMFGAHEIPEIRLTLHLLDRLTVRSPPETIADLAEGMIVLSQKLEGEETTSLLDRTESLLRKAIIEHKNSPRLYALLAEVYYFQHSATPWIERTAEEALKLDPQNDLACILLALIRDVDLDGEREHLGRLKAINPWLFMDDPNSAVRFQKGILMSEVHALKSQE